MDREGDGSAIAASGLSLGAFIECLLFVADEPVHVERLASALARSTDEVDSALAELSTDYARRGLRLQRKGHRVQLVTAPEGAEVVRRFLGLEMTSRLSSAALETLAVVAYRQPVTRTQIEAIRGVGSDSVLRTLLSHGLIEEQGRLDQAGRPIIFGTTFQFLQQFGLTSLEQLPPLDQWQPGEVETPRKKGDRE